MTTLRKAKVNCPKCAHTFTVRDNGGLSPLQADRVWKKFDKAFAAMDCAFASMRKMFR